MASELLVGTRAGLFRVTDGEASRIAVDVRSVTQGPDAVYARTSDGVVRLTDDGETEPLDVPTDDPTHVRADETGFVVAGRGPLAVHTSPDGRRWTTRRLPELPPAERWIDGERVVVDAAGGHVSDSLRTADGVAVGVERHGLLAWTGDDWERRHRGLAEDVHDLHRVGDGEWLAATGHGLYRTTNAGRAWRRLDTGQLFQGYTYFHEFATHDGETYTSGGKDMPGGWKGRGAEAALFRIADGRSPLREADTPAPDEYGWAVASDGDVLRVGTATADLDEGGGDGVVYERTDASDDWRAVCRLPAPVTSLVSLPSGSY